MKENKIAIKNISLKKLALLRSCMSNPLHEYCLVRFFLVFLSPEKDKAKLFFDHRFTFKIF